MGPVVLPPSPNWYGAHLADASPDGKLVAYAAYNRVVLVDCTTQAVVALLAGHSNRVNGVAFAELPTGQVLLLSCSADCFVGWWEVKRPNPNAWQGTLKRQRCPSELTAIAVCRGGQRAFLGCLDGRTLVWDLEALTATPEALKPATRDGAGSPVSCLGSPVSCLAACPTDDNYVAIGRSNGAVEVQGRLQDQGNMVLRAHAGLVQSLSWAQLPSPAGILEGTEGSPPGARQSLLVSGGQDGGLNVHSFRQEGTKIVLGYSLELKLPALSSRAPAAQKPRLWLATCWTHLPPSAEGHWPLIVSGYAGQLLVWNIPVRAGLEPPPPMTINGSLSRKCIFAVCPLHPRHRRTLLEPSQETTQLANLGSIPEAEAAKSINKLSCELASDQVLADSLEQQEEPAGSCGREERPERTATEQQHHDREGAGAAEAAEDVNGPNSSVLKEACLEAAPGPGLEAQGTASTAAALGAASKGTSANGKRDSIAWKSANALQIATISMDRSLLLWNIPNKSGRPEWKAGKVSWHLTGLAGYIWSLAALAHDPPLIAMGCGEKLMSLWDPTAPAKTPAKLLWKGLASNVTALAWAPKAGAAATLAFGCSCGEVGLCDVATEACTAFSIRHKAPIGAVCWLEPSAEGSVLLSLCKSGRLLAWHGLSFPRTATSSHDKTAAVTAGGQIVPLDFMSTVDRDGPVAETVHVTAIASLHDSLAVGFSDGHVEVLRPRKAASGGSPTQRWAVAARILRQSTPVLHLAWSPHGLAVAQKGGHLTVMTITGDSVTGSELEGVSQQLSSDVDALAWSTGTALAVATANKQIQVFHEGPTLQQLQRFPGHRGKVLSLCWNPANPAQLLSGAEDTTLCRWDTTASAEGAKQSAAAVAQQQPGDCEGSTAADQPLNHEPEQSSDTASAEREGVAAAEQPVAHSDQPGVAAAESSGPGTLEDSCAALQPTADSEGMSRLGSGGGDCMTPSDGAASRQLQLPPGAREQDAEAAEAAVREVEQDLLAAKKRELLARVEELAGASSGAVIAGVDWQLGSLLGQLTRQHNATQVASRQTNGTEKQPEERSAAHLQAGDAQQPSEEAVGEAHRRSEGSARHAQKQAEELHGERRQQPGAASQIDQGGPPLSRLRDSPGTEQRGRRGAENLAGAGHDVGSTAGSAVDAVGSALADRGGQSSSAVEMDGDRAEAQSAPTAGARNEARPANLPPGKKKREPSLGARPLLPPIADNSSTLEGAHQALLGLASKLDGSGEAPGGPLQATAMLRGTISQMMQADGGSGQAQRAAALELLRGNVQGALKAVVDADCLTADFVSLAAGAGRAAWVAASKAYAARLEAEGEPQMAALHLLATGDLDASLAAYQRAGLLREAVTLAELRLLPGDARLSALCTAWALQLEAAGQLEAAAEAFLKGKQYGAAVSALAKRGTRSAFAAAVQLGAIFTQTVQLSEADQQRITDVRAGLDQWVEPTQLDGPPTTQVESGLTDSLGQPSTAQPALDSTEPVMESVTESVTGSMTRRRVSRAELLALKAAADGLQPDAAMLSSIPPVLRVKRRV